MTLIKKMSLVVLCLLAIIFIGFYLIILNNERNYFIQQMSNNAQDTATSLGLSLSQTLINKNKAIMLSMVDAVFEHGHFAMIEVRDPQGKLLVSRYAPESKAQVPRWFVNLIKWPQAVQSSIVMSGSTQVGKVFVASNDKYALSALWYNAVELVYWYLLFAIIFLSIVYFFIRWLLKPLRRVTKQAQAICVGEFPIETNIPKTSELKKVTLAMNQMVTRIKQLFKEQLQQMELLRHQSFQDPLTNLGNRRHFLQQVTSLLSDEEEFIPGFMVLVVIDGLDRLNKELGFQHGDKILQEMAKVCITFWPPSAIIGVARISGSNFALLIKESDSDLFIKNCNEFNLTIQKIFATYPLCRGVVAATAYQLHQSPSELLIEIDLVLKRARNEVNGLSYSNLHVFDKITINSDMVKTALSELRVSLFAQWVTSGKENFHQELFVRIIEGGQQICAGYFMSIAEKAGIAYLIDQFVLAKVMANNILNNTTIALNLNAETVINEQNRTNYIEKLEKLPLELRSNLHVEFNETTVLRHFTKSILFIRSLKKLNVKVGIDQVGINFSPMYYLNELPIHYIKLHGSLVHDVAENQNKQFFIHYLNEMAKTLGIQVIAAQVETEKQWLALQNLHLKWGQGRYLSDVEPLLIKKQ